MFKLRAVICGARSHTEQACYVSTIQPPPHPIPHPLPIRFPRALKIRSGKDLSGGGTEFEDENMEMLPAFVEKHQTLKYEI